MLGISQQCVLCQEDQQDELQGSQSCREFSPLSQLLLVPFLSSESLLDVTQPGLGGCALSRRELSRLDGAGPIPAPGEAQPELLVFWESLSLHPTPWAGCEWVPTPALPAVFSAGQGGQERGCTFQFLLACLLSLILACVDRIPLCSDRGRRKS